MVLVDRQSSYQRTIIVFRRSRINKHWRVSRRSEESKAHFNTVSFLNDLPGVWSGTGNRNTLFLEQSAGLDFRIADNNYELPSNAFFILRSSISSYEALYKSNQLVCVYSENAHNTNC
jgi:hypothetical protein